MRPTERVGTLRRTSGGVDPLSIVGVDPPPVLVPFVIFVLVDVGSDAAEVALGMAVGSVGATVDEAACA